MDDCRSTAVKSIVLQRVLFNRSTNLRIWRRLIDDELRIVLFAHLRHERFAAFNAPRVILHVTLERLHILRPMIGACVSIEHNHLSRVVATYATSLVVGGSEVRSFARACVCAQIQVMVPQWAR